MRGTNMIGLTNATKEQARRAVWRIRFACGCGGRVNKRGVVDTALCARHRMCKVIEARIRATEGA